MKDSMSTLIDLMFKPEELVKYRRYRLNCDGIQTIADVITVLKQLDIIKVMSEDEVAKIGYFQNGNAPVWVPEDKDGDNS